MFIVTAVVLLGLLVLAAWTVPYVRVLRDDPLEACAERYPQRRAALRTAEWQWTPPSWTCHFDDGIESGHVP